MNKAFAHTIHKSRIYTPAAYETEQNKVVGPALTIMTLITQRDRDLSPYIDVVDEREAAITISSLKH